jgi:F-type H+-transporting ATPase subunit alpha
MIIYAGTSGGLDDLPANRVGEFEKAFLAYMEDNHPDAGDAIRAAKKDIPDEIKQVLDQAIAAVKGQLSAG